MFSSQLGFFFELFLELFTLKIKFCFWKYQSLYLALFAFLISTVKTEADDGIYPLPVPSDAVFIRRIGEIENKIKLFGMDFDQSDLPENVYTAISSPSLKGAEERSFYTVLKVNDKVEILKEPKRSDPSKVYLFLLNNDRAPASLKVANGGPSVIEETESGHIKTRAVNPVRARLSVVAQSGEQDFDVMLRRGVNLTFYVDKNEARVIENAFGPVLTLP